jgi:crossover junction endodeoxyribonuclease RuvC
VRVEAGRRATARPIVRIVGFDPGLAATGFAALERGPGGIVVLGTGVVRTPARDALDARLEQLFDGAHGVLAAFGPDLVVVEDVFSAPAIPATAILMAQARAMVCLASRQRKLALLHLAPAEVKRAVTASGTAPKGQVARAVQVLLKLAALPRPSHVADALALAFTGLGRARGVEVR